MLYLISYDLNKEDLDFRHRSDEQHGVAWLAE